jgi:uncharacterized protein YigA (DUF484 family)
MTQSATAMTEDDIIAFLNSHPDFLTRNPDLLDVLALPARSSGENVVDFHQLMVNKLRGDKQRAEDRQRSMIDNARTNLTVQARVHAAILRLVEANNLDDLVEIVGGELALMLDVDIITLGLESTINLDIANNNGIHPLPPGLIAHYLGEKDAILQANIDGDPALFGPAARLVKSQAMLRLNIAEGIPDGLLAFGSRDPLLFSDAQGTELIGFLGDVIERLLRRFLDAGH